MDEDAVRLLAARLAQLAWSSSFSVSVLEYRLLQRDPPGLETNGRILTLDTLDTPGSAVDVTGEAMRSHCWTLALLL